MSGNLFLIIFVLLSAWRGISALIEKAAKKKEQERLSELESRRPIAVGTQSSLASSSQSTTPFQQASQDPRTRSRKEELASRRQAQLDELRRRRAGQGSSVKTRSASSGQVGIGTASVPGAPAARPIATPQKRSAQIVTRKADLKSIRLQQDRQVQIKRQKEIQLQKQKRASELAEERRDDIDRARIKADRKAFSQKAQSGLGRSSGSIASKSILRSKRIETGSIKNSVLKRVKDHRSLREMFILKELLDPPLALREPIG